MSTATIPTAPNSATASDMQQAFQRQQAHTPVIAATSAKERVAKLKNLQQYLIDHGPEIEEAIFQDFKKPGMETFVSELMVVHGEINHVTKHLSTWMKPSRVPTPLSMTGTFSHVRYEPRGTVLIISPWNYPVQLTLCPLITAIAAGNTVIIKPSELSPNTSAWMAKMVKDLFQPEEIALFEGNHEVAQALLALPFNHMYFTGSPQVGKIVMRAAAEHLSSITLELGGKTPTIVDASANLFSAADKIAWGKCLNNGQSCVAPDYLMIHESVKDGFVEKFGAALKRMYGDDAQQSDSFARIINRRHFDRIVGLLEDAKQKGAKVLIGGKTDPEDLYIEPTLLDGVTAEMRIMQEEIFGPILPMTTFRDIQEVTPVINSADRERPLSTYIFSRNKRNIDTILDGATSGGVAINETMIQFGHTELPKGGVNRSGIGATTGHHGFKAFSHERGVFIQKYGTLKFLYPPYSDGLKNMIKKALKLI
ncbi:aldehyde dehydrogenase family protein [Pontibacter sp. G13]|uniref:aldehyde dehydrogenase family protein n=1 Tax=Pontibacter sp. G13 TaxID=3074898 RepID=UPI00288943BA|nr:aldehyde dehydrogenase family protein [Pontibacter sp. G13]WNJ21245.1 aldehyde dehydrogenase family protein [Pontibacter sp. G13]